MISSSAIFRRHHLCACLSQSAEPSAVGKTFRRLFARERPNEYANKNVHRTFDMCTQLWRVAGSRAKGRWQAGLRLCEASRVAFNIVTVVHAKKKSGEGRKKKAMGGRAFGVGQKGIPLFARSKDPLNLAQILTVFPPPNSIQCVDYFLFHALCFPNVFLSASVRLTY